MSRVDALRVYSGSKIYGTETPDSDLDTISAYVPTSPTELYCLVSFWKEGKQKIIDGADDREYDLRYFMSMARQGTTTALESLFVRPEHILTMATGVEYILAYAPNMLSQMMITGPAIGFARAEYRSFTGETTGKLGIKRKEDMEKYGYVRKSAHHCLRVLGQSLSALDTGTYSPYPDDHEDTVRKALGLTNSFDWRHLLMEIKRGNTRLSLIKEAYKSLAFELLQYHVAESKTPKISPFPLHKDSKNLAEMNEIIGKVMQTLTEQANAS